MKIVSIPDYAIIQRIGRSESSGTTYTTRFGNVRHWEDFKDKRVPEHKVFVFEGGDL